MNKTGEKSLFYRLNDALDAVLAAQRDRMILWAPVMMGVGVGIYFGMRHEPDLIWSVSLAVLSLALLLRARIWQAAPGIARMAWLSCCSLFLISLGFAISKARSDFIATPMLEKEIRITQVTGTIRGIDFLEEGTGMRIVLGDLEIEKLVPEKTPEFIRLRLRKGDDLRVGDRVTMRAGLNPPAAPVAPGAFDFQRYAYFHHIGAFGFTYDMPQVIGSEHGSASQFFEHLREVIARRIRDRMQAAEAGVSTALITNEATSIPDKAAQDLRISGLFHVVSVSGLHISLAAGIFFFAARFLMACVPPFALRHPIKKYAALIAFAGALFYTLLAGSEIPTVRSLIMTGLMLLAIMLDRLPFSSRLVAVAALGVLTLWPEALWGASFQMSFAAVTCLIVIYEDLRPYISGWHARGNILLRILMYFAGVCATTIIASLAIAPLSVYHFQQLGLYSLLANAVATPVIAFVIMPAAVLACLLMPFGLDAWPLLAMEKGVTFMLWVSREVAALPHSAMQIHALPFSFLILVVVGVLWLLLWKGWRGKILALVPLAAAGIIASGYKPPDLLVSGSAKLMAVRTADGKLALSSLRAEKFVAENWMRRNGQNEQTPLKWPKEGVDAGAGLSCGIEGCIFRRNEKTAAFAFTPATQREDCMTADILVATQPMRDRSGCRATVIDRFDLWRNGAHAIWLDGRVETVGGMRGTRPWTISNHR